MIHQNRFFLHSTCACSASFLDFCARRTVRIFVPGHQRSLFIEKLYLTSAFRSGCLTLDYRQLAGLSICRPSRWSWLSPTGGVCALYGVMIFGDTSSIGRHLLDRNLSFLVLIRHRISPGFQHLQSILGSIGRANLPVLFEYSI